MIAAAESLLISAPHCAGGTTSTIGVRSGLADDTAGHSRRCRLPNYALGWRGYCFSQDMLFMNGIKRIGVEQTIRRHIFYE